MPASDFIMRNALFYMRILNLTLDSLDKFMVISTS